MSTTTFAPVTTAKLDKMIKAISRNGITAYSKHSIREFSSFLQSVEFMREDFEKIKTGTHPVDVVGVLIGLRTVLSDDTSFIRAVAAGDMAKAWTLWSRCLTQNYALHHLLTSMDELIRPLSHAALPRFLLGLQSIGWQQEAREYCEHIFTHCTDSSFDIIPEELFAWFSIYFTLGSRDLIAPTTFKEPNKPDSIYSTMLGDWQNEEPAELSKTLARYGEYNVDKTLLASSKRPVDLDSPDLLFIPFDILSINMRRKVLGLSWVETGDPRMNGWPVSTDKMPLVKDNVTWPIYLELCEMAGVTPFSSEHEITITLDPETLELME